MKGMKVWVVRASMTLGIAAMLLAAKALIVRPVDAQSVPGTGFSSLVCTLGVDGVGTYGLPNGEVVIDVVSDSVDSSTHVGTAEVVVYHGKSSSDHIVTYQDNGDNHLDCGDSVISIQ